MEFLPSSSLKRASINFVPEARDNVDKYEHNVPTTFGFEGCDWDNMDDVPEIFRRVMSFPHGLDVMPILQACYLYHDSIPLNRAFLLPDTIPYDMITKNIALYGWRIELMEASYGFGFVNLSLESTDVIAILVTPSFKTLLHGNPLWTDQELTGSNQCIAIKADSNVTNHLALRRSLFSEWQQQWDRRTMFETYVSSGMPVGFISTKMTSQAAEPILFNYLTQKRLHIYYQYNVILAFDEYGVYLKVVNCSPGILSPIPTAALMGGYGALLMVTILSSSGNFIETRRVAPSDDFRRYLTYRKSTKISHDQRKYGYYWFMELKNAREQCFGYLKTPSSKKSFDMHAMDEVVISRLAKGLFALNQRPEYLVPADVGSVCRSKLSMVVSYRQPQVIRVLAPVGQQMLEWNIIVALKSSEEPPTYAAVLPTSIEDYRTSMLDLISVLLFGDDIVRPIMSYTFNSVNVFMEDIDNNNNYRCTSRTSTIVIPRDETHGFNKSAALFAIPRGHNHQMNLFAFSTDIWVHDDNVGRKFSSGEGKEEDSLPLGVGYDLSRFDQIVPPNIIGLLTGIHQSFIQELQDDGEEMPELIEESSIPSAADDDPGEWPSEVD